MRCLLAFVAIASVLAVSAPALAQDAPATPPSARKMDLAWRYVRSLHENGAPTSSDAFISLMPELRDENRQIKPEFKAIFDQVVSETNADLRAKMEAAMAEISADLFTEQELEGIIAFHESEAGKALGRKTPTMMARLMATQIDSYGDFRIFARRRLCAKIACANPPE
jgi:hypothetical protein